MPMLLLPPLAKIFPHPSQATSAVTCVRVVATSSHEVCPHLGHFHMLATRCQNPALCTPTVPKVLEIQRTVLEIFY